MAISWGPWEYSGGNGMRTGIEVTTSAVTNASTSVTFTVKYYTENQFQYSDNQTFTKSGNNSGTFTYSNTSSGGAVLRNTDTDVFTYSTYGTSPGNRTYTGAVSGTYNGVSPSVTVTKAIPARPLAVPAAQSSVTATRNSDSQITVTWVRNSTAAAAYADQTVQMRTWTGSAWSAYSTVATASSSATSYVKTGLVANRGYQFQIRANNAAGSSAYVATSAVYMTPANPSAVTSVLNPTGTSITTTWTNNAYTNAGVTWTIERSVAGGAFAALSSGIAQGTTTFTDNTPGAGTNQYRVKAVQATGSLSSGFGTGNTVSTVTPPLAPTPVSPASGSAADLAADGAVFTWVHNPGGDGAAQTHFTLETSANAGSTWQVRGNDVASSVASFTLAPAVLTNGVTYLWRVRTEGVVTGGYGPNSANFTLIGSTKPVVTITVPATTTTAPPLSATWTYTQAQSSPQAAWEASLYAADGVTLLEAKSGTGTGLSTTFAYVGVNGTSYVVKVRAQSGAGVWSTLVTKTTTYSLLPPADVTATPVFDACSGTVTIGLVAAAAVGGVTVAVTTVDVERSVDGGVTWVRIAKAVGGLPADVTDPLPPTRGDVTYRVTATSATPSLKVMTPVTITVADDTGLWAWVSYGDAFQNEVRVRGDLQVNESAGRVSEARHFLGRAKPVLMTGVSTDRSVTVSGVLRYNAKCIVDDGCTFDSTPTDWRTAGLMAGVVCYRDYTGRRFFGMLGPVSVTDQTWPGMAAVGFSVTEVDFTEAYS